MGSIHISDALVPWDPQSNQAVAKIEDNCPDGRWALILSGVFSSSPGRTLGRVYTSLGKVLETHANRAAYSFGLGPHVVAQKIKSHFGNGTERVLQLETLHTSISPRLEKWCHKLMRYALPCVCHMMSKLNLTMLLRTESEITQSRAFKDIVDIVTLFPGLRALLLHAKYIEGVTSTEDISSLWNRIDGLPDDELRFWKMLAATCLADTTISAILEDSTVPLRTTCDAEGLSVIEQLLIEHDCS
jgi:hypothetical protein